MNSQTENDESNRSASAIENASALRPPVTNEESRCHQDAALTTVWSAAREAAILSSLDAKASPNLKRARRLGLTM